jgi:hypothetical protein
MRILRDDNPDALEACRYVIARVQARAGRRWRQGARAVPLACDALDEDALLVARRRLCGVPEIAARALCAWVREPSRALRLAHAPTARAVLALAARGRRPVSLLDGEEGLAFALHDLCHLEKFHDPEHHRGQVGLFRLLDRVVDGPGWGALEAGLDDDWRAHRDHVLADMNGSPVFLYLVLRARLVDACARAGIAGEERARTLAGLLGASAVADRAALAAYFASCGA